MKLHPVHVQGVGSLPFFGFLSLFLGWFSLFWPTGRRIFSSLGHHRCAMLLFNLIHAKLAIIQFLEGVIHWFLE